VVPLLHSLRSANKGALFSYSVEADDLDISNKDFSRKQVVNEMVNSIDVAADFEDAHSTGQPGSRKTWVSVKMASLL
jgi:proline dehydrogenase